MFNDLIGLDVEEAVARLSLVFRWMLVCVAVLVPWSNAAADQLGELKQRAEGGDVRAMVDVGSNYYYARGVGQDYGEALKWFRRAADLGDAEGMYDLGVMYDKGTGVPMNPAEALVWFNRAAKAGNAGAMYNLGIVYGIGSGVPKDMTIAVKWFRLAADKGDGNAMEKLGEIYATGRGGIPIDLAESTKWFQMGAEHGDAQAMGYLSTCYHLGRGIGRNDLQAYYWGSMAVLAGTARAQPLRDALKQDLPADEVSKIELKVMMDWIRISAQKATDHTTAGPDASGGTSVPPRTCKQVRARLDADGTITQDDFKQLMIAMGYTWNPTAEQNIAGLCKAAAIKIPVTQHQQLWPTRIIFNAKVVDDKGVCRLKEVSLDQCE